MSEFPTIRMRRLRQGASLRQMLAEVRLSADQLIAPLFVGEGTGVRREISSMPGQFQFSLDTAMETLRRWSDAGILGVLLFGLGENKDAEGSGAWDDNAAVQRLIRQVKKDLPHLVVFTDVCLCEYTSHGHCGIISDGCVQNDETLELLAETALSHARAGADIVAPSDMMDARVRAIRSRLDEYDMYDTAIMAYSAKYASAFYGPFREAAECAPQFGDRKAYQMDPANAREALKEVELDIQEGADVVMVKPALSYLDIIRQVKDNTDLPVAAYNVSGEYSMVKAAALNGWIDEQRVTMEILTSIKRAGADIILTYHAKDAARWLQGTCPP